MKNLFVCFVCVLLILSIGAHKSFAQQDSKSVSVIRIKFADYNFIVPVIREPKFLMHNAVFMTQTSHRACDLTLSVAAIEKRDRAVVSFNIGMQVDTKGSSYRKSVELRKGETKNFKLKLSKCFDNKFSSILASFESETLNNVSTK